VTRRQPNEAWHIDVTILKLLHPVDAPQFFVVDGLAKRGVHCSVRNGVGEHAVAVRVEPCGVAAPVVQGEVAPAKPEVPEVQCPKCGARSAVPEDPKCSARSAVPEDP
jgi:hypothetical protein